MKFYKYKNPNNFLSALQDELIIPKKTKDVYLYLPLSMISIYSTIERFSNFDLTTGIENRKSFFYLSTSYVETNSSINLGKNIYLEKKNKKNLKVIRAND